jgi:hypothetical protein
VLRRREIIRAAMTFSDWSVLRPSATAQRIPGSGAPEDETFWAFVRYEFELSAELPIWFRRQALTCIGLTSPLTDIDSRAATS